MIKEKKYTKEELLNILSTLDKEVSLTLGTAKEQGGYYQLILVGGSVMLMSDLTERNTTKDIDTFGVPFPLIEIVSHYDLINSASLVYEDYLPYNYEDRLVQLDIETEAIIFARPSNEDLAVMKLYSNRTIDQDDLECEAFYNSLDWDLLDHLVYDEDEAIASSLSPDYRYKFMVRTYENYAKKHGHVPNSTRVSEKISNISYWEEYNQSHDSIGGSGAR